MTLSQFFRHVFLQRRYVTDSTVTTYWATINRFQDWHGKPILLSKLSPDLLRAFLVDYRASNSDSSVNQKRNTMLVLWRFAHRWGKCKTPPPESHEIPKLPVPKRTPVAWTLDEFRRLIGACVVARSIHKDGKRWDERHWRALFLVIYDTGERISALLQVNRRDLAHTGHLTIRGEFRKGKNRDIVRLLHEQTLDAIAQLPVHTLLFPWPLNDRKIYEELNSILHAAGLPIGRRWKFHCVRRTSATQAAVSLGVVAASRHLDHSNVQLTVDRYIDPRQLPDHDVANTIARPDLG